MEQKKVASARPRSSNTDSADASTADVSTADASTADASTADASTADASTATPSVASTADPVATTARARPKRRHRLTDAERQARDRDAQRRRDDRQYKLHATYLEDAIADKPPAPNVIGAAAEDRAVAALEADGYQIVTRNWKRDLGELDVVARDGDILVFVEVRSREDDEHGHAAEMVSWQKRGKVTKVAYLYLVLEKPAYDQCRFDVVAVTGDSVEIIKDAWRG